MKTSPHRVGRSSFFKAIVIVLGVFLPGCASDVVTHAVRTDRFEFNEAIVQSWNEQLLLNLVRLRYRDNPLFLEMGSIIAGYTMRGTAGLTGGIVFTPQVTDDLRLSLGGEFTFAPTMTYTPLQGEDFATRLLSPVTPLTVLYLSQSGWSLARLFTVCVQEANTIPNAVSASGPTPDIAPEFDSFREVTEALRELQIKGRLLVALDTDGKTVLLHIIKGKGQSEDAPVAVVRRILALDPDTSVYRVKPGLVRESATEIAVMGPEGAVNILYKRELEAAADAIAARAEKVAEFRDKFANPFIAAGRGYLDEVIRPRETRRKLITALRRLDTKRDRNPAKKHGNIPL